MAPPITDQGPARLIATGWSPSRISKSHEGASVRALSLDHGWTRGSPPPYIESVEFAHQGILRTFFQRSIFPEKREGCQYRARTRLIPVRRRCFRKDRNIWSKIWSRAFPKSTVVIMKEGLTAVVYRTLHRPLSRQRSHSCATVCAHGL